jgi:hypothetical protein
MNGIFLNIPEDTSFSITKKKKFEFENLFFKNVFGQNLSMSKTNIIYVCQSLTAYSN